MVGKQCAVDKIPIDEEGALQRIDNSSSHLQMGVAPGNATSSTNVAQGNIHSTNKSYLAINDTKFAMVAIVHFAGEGGEAHRHKSVDVYAAVAHSLENALE